MSVDFLIETAKKIQVVINDNSSEIEKLDQEIGDGDHIFNVQRGIKLVIELEPTIKDLIMSKALNQIAMKVLSGIVGHSGAGKSTLVNSILGLTKIYEGNISIGKILINETPIQDWRSLIGYIPQEIMLFNTTIFENIIWAKKNASKNEVIKCAKQAQAHDFIMEKKDGYFTHIGDKGTVLSGGQKQRIAIARALITRPKILIMDESTNSLDYDSEMKINKTIEILKKTTCVIVISHKINNLKNADKIIFMKNGKVEEQDSWDKLIKLKKNFYDFVKKYEVKRY